jgi:rhomboid protease GluP
LKVQHPSTCLSCTPQINSYTLNSLGPHVELLAGRARFAAVYLGSTLLGSTASYLMTPAPSVGASAGLFGLGAALAVCYARNGDALGRRRSEAVLQQLGLTLLLNMAYSMTSKRIDNW